MKIAFSKYHGAGNDFVIIDNRTGQIELNTEQIRLLCDRRFGVGSDGLILMQTHDQLDFEMVYYNSDGNQSSMCGNGGRCLVAYAKILGQIDQKTEFQAIDGIHSAIVLSEDTVSLEMTNVSKIEALNDQDFLLDTGSPHFVRFVDDVLGIDLIAEARQIRYSEKFKEQGVNVNFVSQKWSDLAIRTYERGVENETLACGTGVTAAAIAAHKKGIVETNVKLKALGGDLEVSFDVSTNGYSNVWKTGPVKLVFNGKIEL